MENLSTPKKVAATIMLVSGIIGSVAYTIVATHEIGKMYGHPIRKLIAARAAKKMAKGFNPDTASW